MSLFAPYIPIDRRLALATGEPLPDRTAGTAVFADLSGFTQLTARLAETLGRKRGAEELLPLLNRIYTNIVRAIQDYGGSVIHFSGDAVTCWFDGDDGRRAITASVVMQREIAAFESVSVPGGFTASISMKVSISCGEVRRLLVGSPQHMVCDVLAGRLVDEVALGERLAKRGEVLLSESLVGTLGPAVSVSEWREGNDGVRFAVLDSFHSPAESRAWSQAPPIREVVAAQYVLPSVAERLRKGEGHYLAEIRPATAVFVQFSGLDYDSDELAGEKLDRYVRWVQEVIEQYEGVLLQLTIGDKGAYFFLGFGAPVAHSDDVSRAAAAALALRETPSELESIQNIKIGIAHGQMRTGAYGGAERLSYGVLGEKVNRAARLMSYAPVGEIYCDDSVYASIHNRWEMEMVPLRTDKVGIGETVPLGSVYRLTGQTVARAQQVDLTRGLVGRESEVEQLTSLLTETAAGSPGFAWVSGEAGIGKSHLIQEIARRADYNGFSVFTGSGSSIEQRTAYWAWRAVLAGFFGWDERWTAAQRMERVESVVQNLSPEHMARLPVLNDVAYLGVPENDLTRSLPTALRLDNVVLLISELLRGRSATQPVVVILEDVHWIDDLSWQLSLRVAERLHEFNERAAVIWTTRPAADKFGQDRSQKAHALPGLRGISLDPMPAADLRQLISMELGLRSGEVPEELDRFVQEKAEGNPLYARELVVTLKDRRLIWNLGAGSESPWQLAADFHLAASALPDTLQGLILARIDRLSLDQQTILKVASVIGRAFKRSTLAHTVRSFAETAYNGFDKHLGALHEAGLVQGDGDAAYLFNHILTRDTTYQTLLFAQRRQLHAQVAGWFEGVYPGDSLAPFYPTLAYHYRHAELPEREYGYVCKSADQAKKRYANREALEYFARALDLTDSPDDQFRLRLQREEIYGLVGDRTAQAAELAEMELLCRSYSRDAWYAELSIRFAQFHLLNGSYSEAMVNAGQVIHIGEQTGDRKILARGAHIRGKVHLQQGDYQEAAGFFNQALDAYLVEETDGPIAEVFGDYGILQVYLGDYRRAIPYFERAIEIYQSANNRREVARNQSNLAGAYGLMREFQKAIKNYKESYEINREIGERRNAHGAQGNLGSIYLTCGEYNLAKQHLQEALITSRAIGDLRKEGNWLGSLGEVSMAIGRYDEATSYFLEALTLTTNLGNKDGMGHWANRLGEANLLMGYFEAASNWIARALEIYGEIGNQSGLAKAYQTNAQILTAQGLWEEASSAINEAFRIWTEQLQPSHQVTLYPALALIAWNLNQEHEAARNLEEFWSFWVDYTEQQRQNTDLWAILAASRIYGNLGDNYKAKLLTEFAYDTLISRAERISDKDLRREFLESVRLNREILELNASSRAS